MNVVKVLESMRHAVAVLGRYLIKINKSSVVSYFLSDSVPR
jgi:hypothetical protein